MDDISWKPLRRHPCPWPAERIAMLQAMMAEGRPRAEIAIALGVSRNAVIGMCWRLGLSTPREHIRIRVRKPWKPKPKPKPKPKGKTVQAIENAACGTTEPATNIPQNIPSPCDFMGLTSRACRWPLWSDTARVPFSEQWYCGQVVVCQEGPYCPTHTALAYGRGGAR